MRPATTFLNTRVEIKYLLIAQLFTEILQKQITETYFVNFKCTYPAVLTETYCEIQVGLCWLPDFLCKYDGFFL